VTATAEQQEYREEKVLGTTERQDGKMIIVVGAWEIGYMTPIMEANYWNLPLRDFEVSEWYMSPVTGVQHNEKRLINLHEYNNYDEVLENIDPELPRVFIEPRTKHQNPDTVWLHEFEPPQDCVYIFGSAHYNPTLKHKREQDTIVTIKTIQDKGVLWSNQCVVTVLYDRNIKWQY
jgi:hypothetical protein